MSFVSFLSNVTWTISHGVGCQAECNKPVAWGELIPSAPDSVK